MPKIAGPWLAGGYDSDRAVARAAQEALGQVFPTPEKVQNVRKAFQAPLLEYCRDAILKETPQTLSDERTVSPDDAEATYARVIATSLSVVSSLLHGLSREGVEKQQELYDEILGDGKLWSFGTFSDVAVRRYTHRLLRTCIENQTTVVERSLGSISTAYVYKGLVSDQTGSSLDFAQALEALTKTHPSVWTTAYTGKKSAESRLRQFLKRGSQTGPPVFWTYVGRTLAVMPAEVLVNGQDEAVELLNSMRDGVTKREERFSASEAWHAYFSLVDILTSSLPEQDASTLTETFVIPIIQQYLQPSPETAGWAISGAKTPVVVSQAALVRTLAPALEARWPELATRLIEDAKTSLPEQSKDFDKSQTAVSASGERFALLQREFQSGSYTLPQSLSDAFSDTSAHVVRECISILRSRNGKPYCAAAIIHELLSCDGERLLQDASIAQELSAFLGAGMLDMLFSPSASHIVSCLYACKSEAFFDTAFSNALDSVITSEQLGPEKIGALRKLFTHHTPEHAVQLALTPKLQLFLGTAFGPAGTASDWSFCSDLLKLGILSESTTSHVLSELTKSLAPSNSAADALQGMQKLAISNEAALRGFMSKPEGEQLLPNLLRLEDSPNEAQADMATQVSKRLTTGTATSGSASHGRFNVVLQNLEAVSNQSLPMRSVHDLTSRLLGDSRNIEDSAHVMPDLAIWELALASTMTPPAPSLAITSPLGGAVYLAKNSIYASEVQATVSHDADGLSQALRMAMYVARLTSTTNLQEILGREDLSTVLHLLYLTVLVANDNISVVGSNPLWVVSTPETEPEVLDFIAEAGAFTTNSWHICNIFTPQADPSTAFVVHAVEAFLERTAGTSSAQYYHALAYSNATSEMTEVYGYSSAQTKQCEEKLKVLRGSTQVFAVLSCLVGFQQPLGGSQAMTRYCNELVADLTACDVAAAPGSGLKLLVILNAIIQHSEEAVESIAKQRLIFLVKHIVPWLEADVPNTIKAETYRALTVLLPGMQEIYGEHWSQILRSLIEYWTSAISLQSNGLELEDRLPVTHSSLKLYAALKTLLRSEEPNDDMVDALKEEQSRIRNGLIQLLRVSEDVPDEAHQPQAITNDLLSRQIMQLPDQPMEDPGELYPLLYTASSSVQQAAFSLLHKHIPKAQEKVSFDAALEHKTAQLPEELLSLIIEAPSLDALANASFDRTMPLPLQGYLFSWRLLFDHFASSSYKVKSDYIEELKDGTCLSEFLDFAFDFLGHSRGKPIDASKFDIVDYASGVEETPEKDVQWLLTHLYYLCLTHIPSLTKTYYLSIKSRQTSLAVESWTAKYISPLIIGASLSSVAEWASTSVKEDPDYEKMTVKVGLKSKEVNASYLVDEQTMAIVVRLPDTYPLAAAKVEGVSRVAVKEEKWQSWLRNCQGVITFSVSLSLSSLG